MSKTKTVNLSDSFWHKESKAPLETIWHKAAFQHFSIPLKNHWPITEWLSKNYILVGSKKNDRSDASNADYHLVIRSSSVFSCTDISFSVPVLSQCHIMSENRFCPPPSAESSALWPVCRMWTDSTMGPQQAAVNSIWLGVTWHLPGTSLLILHPILQSCYYSSR